MTKLLLLLLLSFSFAACNSDSSSGSSCKSAVEAENADGSSDDCSLAPVAGESSGTSTSGGASTGGEASSGGSSGGEESTGGSSGGTETTGGTTGGGTETTGGSVSGGASTGGTTTGGTTSGGTTSGGTTTGGTSSGGSSSGGTTTGGLPNEAYTFDTNLQYFNFSVTRKTKILKAEDLVKLVIATEEFRTRVLNHTYNGVKTYVDNGGFSNAQIYQKILEGAESLQPAKNNAMDVEVEIYTDTTSNTVGYTYANSKRIWMNTKYFDQYTASSVSANLMHEWLHKLGFKHAVNYSTSRDYSVPYAIGRIVGDIARKNL